MSPAFTATHRSDAAGCRAGALACVASVLALTGCDGAALGDTDPPVEPAHRSFDAIPTTPVQGTIRAAPFAVHDARYRVDRRQGYEKIDITLSAGRASTPCGRVEPTDAPSVWLRRQGAAPIAATELRVEPGTPAAWEVHHQIRVDGRWLGSGKAAALVRLQPRKASTTVDGLLSACFADGRKSCVAGAFEARHCPAQLDMPIRGNEPVEQLPGPALDAGGD